MDRLLEGNAFVNHIDVLLSQTHQPQKAEWFHIPSPVRVPTREVGTIKKSVAEQVHIKKAANWPPFFRMQMLECV